MVGLQQLLLICASILLVGLQWSSCSEAEVAGCSQRERDALLQFRTKLDDPNGLLSSWKGRDCCRWRGVGCSSSGDNNTSSTGVHVVKLDLHNPKDGFNGFFDYSLALTGEIYPSLVNLEHLQHLDLSGNDFGQSSSFPVFISEFQELRSLNLSSTNLLGSIPSELGNLSRILSLDFSFNTELTLENGDLLSRFSSLEYLDMTGVNMGAASGWLESLNTLPLISVIRLMQCQIESLPVSLPLVNFTSLTTLDLSQNFMINSHFPDWLFRLTRIEHLNFGNTISGDLPPIPAGIGNLHELRFLDFSSNQLAGSIPESLGNLSFIEEIDLSENKLSGPIPKSLGRLSSLRKLDLSNNELSQSIPESIFKISSLQKLLLPNNNLTGSIPTSIGTTTLKSLQHLNLGSNTMTGSIPTSIGDLKSLEEFDLSNNRFVGSIPESLCNLTVIKIFDLSYNNGLNGTVPKCLFQNPHLQKVGIGGNGIQGVISASDLENLSELDSLMIIASKSLVLNISENWIPPFDLSLLFLHSCKLGPRFPMWIQTQKNLICLSMTSTGISGNLPAWIWNFSSLITIIDISSNDFSGNLPHLTNAPSISDISVGFNKFEGFDWFSGLWKMMPNIQFLSLTSNHLNGSVPASVCKSSNLQGLDLSANFFSGRIPSCLMKINNYLNLKGNNFTGPFPSPKNNKSLPCSLKSLHLGSNRLSGILPDSFQSCSNVIVLDLGQNMLSGNIPPWIAESMRGLKILRLKSNMFTGEIPPSLSGLPSLQVVDLSQNNLSGTIPTSFGELAAMTYKHSIVESMGDFYDENISVNTEGKSTSYTTLLPLVTSIDISGNGLVGEIPGELGKLIGLVFLKLSSNHLTGRIPKMIAGLEYLEALDLSQNHLSGQIPEIMTKMTLLNKLNLSFNNLSGSIPTGNQFDTFIDPSMFMGNPYLCGSPMERCSDDNQGILPAAASTGGSDDVAKSWIYLSATFGFILGFWGFYGTLFFKKTWRYSYFQYITQMNDRMYVWCIRKML